MKQALFAAIALLAAACAAPARPQLPKAECVHDSDCAGGKICSAVGTCIEACASDRDCAAGETCAAGECARPTGRCLGAADCAAGETCAPNGVCAKKCATAAECGPGMACVANACFPLAAECAKDADCPPERTCGAGGACVAKCAAPSDCAPRETCSAGACVPAPAECTTTSDCASPKVCSSVGRCVAQCTVDRDCGASQRCAAGVCELLPPQCRRTSDCPADKACVAGTCAAPCVDSRDCGLGAVCASGRCVPPQPECVLNSDCPSGKACAPTGACVSACGATAACAGGEECSAGACVKQDATVGAIVGQATLAGLADHSSIAIELRGPGTVSGAAKSDGTFRFAGLPPGRYTLGVSAPSTREGRLVQELLVKAGADATATTVSLTPVGSVSGKATRNGATTHEGTQVFAQGAAVSTTTDATGRYALIGLPVGTWDVTATYPGFVAQKATAVKVEYGKATTVADLALDAVPQVSGSTFAFTTTPPRQAYVGRPFAYTARAQGGGVTQVGYALSGGPATMTIDAASGIVTYTPLDADRRDYTVVIEAAGGGLRVYQVFAFTVTAPLETLATHYSGDVEGAGGVAWATGDYEVTRIDATGKAVTFDRANTATTGTVSAVSVVNGGNVSQIDIPGGTLTGVSAAAGALAGTWPGGVVGTVTPRDTLTSASVTYPGGTFRGARVPDTFTIAGAAWTGGVAGAFSDARRTPTGVDARTGVVSSLTATELTDAAGAYLSGELAGKNLCLTDALVSKTFAISANTATTITVGAGDLTTGLASGRRYFVVDCTSKLVRFALTDAGGGFPAAPGYAANTKKVDLYASGQSLGLYAVTGSDTGVLYFNAPVSLYGAALAVPSRGFYALTDTTGLHLVTLSDSAAALASTTLAATNKLAFEGATATWVITANDATSITFQAAAGTLFNFGPGMRWLLTDKTASAFVDVTATMTTSTVPPGATGVALFVDEAGARYGVTSTTASEVHALVPLSAFPLNRWATSLAALVSSAGAFNLELTDDAASWTAGALVGLRVERVAASATLTDDGPVTANTSTTLTIAGATIGASCGCVHRVSDSIARYSGAAYALGVAATSVRGTVALQGSPNLSPDALVGRVVALASAPAETAKIVANGAATLTVTLDNSNFDSFATLAAGEKLLVAQVNSSNATVYRVGVTDAAGGLAADAWAGYQLVAATGKVLGAVSGNTATTVELALASAADLPALAQGSVYAFAQPAAAAGACGGSTSFIAARATLQGGPALTPDRYEQLEFRTPGNALKKLTVLGNGAAQIDLLLCPGDFGAFTQSQGRPAALTNAGLVTATVEDSSASWAAGSLVGKRFAFPASSAVTPGVVGNTGTAATVELDSATWFDLASSLVLGSTYALADARTYVDVTLKTDLNVPVDSLAYRFVTVFNKRRDDSRRLLVRSNTATDLKVSVYYRDLGLLRTTSGDGKFDLLTTTLGATVKVTDSTASFTPDALRGRTVRLGGKSFLVLTNTATTLTLTSVDYKNVVDARLAGAYTLVGLDRVHGVAALASGEAWVANDDPAVGTFKLGPTGVTGFVGRLTGARALTVSLAPATRATVVNAWNAGSGTQYNDPAWAFSPGALAGAYFAREDNGNFTQGEIVDNSADTFFVNDSLPYTVRPGETLLVNLFDIQVSGATLVPNELAGKRLLANGYELPIRSNTANTVRVVMPTVFVSRNPDLAQPAPVDPRPATAYVLAGPDDYLSDVAVDGAGQLWFGSDGGLFAWSGSAWTAQLRPDKLNPADASGTATGSASRGSLIDTSASFTPGALVGHRLVTASGIRTISANTATELTFNGVTGFGQVARGDDYTVVPNGVEYVETVAASGTTVFAATWGAVLKVTGTTVAALPVTPGLAGAGPLTSHPCTGASNLASDGGSGFWSDCYGSGGAVRYDGTSFRHYTRALTETAAGKADGLASDNVYGFGVSGTKAYFANGSSGVSVLDGATWSQLGAKDGLGLGVYDVYAPASGAPLFGCSSSVVRLLP